MESLEHKIGYTFQDRSLLQESLTHSSYANERHGRVRCNERMEFLGDAVLSIVSAELLYTRFPDMPEGQAALGAGVHPKFGRVCRPDRSGQLPAHGQG